MYKQNVIYGQVQGFIQMEGDRKMNMKRIFQKIIVVLLAAVDITDTICTGGWYVI